VTVNECPSCGKELAKDMMFCPYCGTKIQPSIQSAEAGMREKVEGVVPLAIARDGNEEGHRFTLIVTASRLIVAKLKEEDEDKVRKASGSILLGGAILEPERHRQALGAYSRRYLTMDPEAILEESQGNGSMRIKDIRGLRITSEEDSEENLFYLISLDTSTGLRKYQIPADKDSRNVLMTAFGDRVHW
jgi:hypothetical protein